ncbi:hypothetical protein ACHAQH_005932 [Verticillium albo-atrum]
MNVVVLEHRNVTAVSREASVNSKSNNTLRDLGAQVIAGDLRGPEQDLVRLLTGADVVISAVNASVLVDEKLLANAAKKARKEDVLNHAKKLRLPYTVIVADDRTLNKMVFAHNELFSQQQIFDKVEQLTGEKLERSYLPATEVDAEVAKRQQAVHDKVSDPSGRQGIWMWEYRRSWGLRGDNTPENVPYLDYYLGKELHPDMEFTSFDKYLEELLEGKAKKPWA